MNSLFAVDVLRQSEQDQAVVELCDYIASEQYQLYNLFNQNVSNQY